MQMHEMKGPGDTFDVSWSFDGTLLSACFSSGSLIVQDVSLFKKFIELTTEAISNLETVKTSILLCEAAKAVANVAQIIGGSSSTGPIYSTEQAREVITPCVPITGSKTAAASAKTANILAKQATKELPKEAFKASVQIDKSSFATTGVKAESELRNLTPSNNGSNFLSGLETSLPSASHDTVSGIHYSQTATILDDSTVMIVEIPEPLSHAQPQITADTQTIKQRDIASIMSNGSSSLHRNGVHFTTHSSMDIASETTNEATKGPHPPSALIPLETIANTIESTETAAVSESVVGTSALTVDGVMEIPDHAAN